MKKRTIIMYILTFIVIGLISFLIYFMITFKENTIRKECILHVDINILNSILDRNLTGNLCHGYNQINTDVSLQNNTLKLKTIIYNGDNHKQTDEEGIYLNDKKIISNPNSSTNKFFKTSELLYLLTPDNNNLLVFSSSGEKIYNLQNSLNKNTLIDQNLTKVMQAETRVTFDMIDIDSFVFDDSGFSFNTSIKKECPGNITSKGSIYRVNYNSQTFQNPTYVSDVPC